MKRQGVCLSMQLTYKNHKYQYPAYLDWIFNNNPGCVTHEACRGALILLGIGRWIANGG